MISKIVTAIFLLAIVYIFIYDRKNHKRELIIGDLKKITYLINNEKKLNMSVISDKFLLERLTEFEAKKTIYDDISDYINMDSINDYIRKDLTDTYSGMFTGLGILGTFVGLVIGLVGFDIGDIGAGDAIEKMSKSIPNLMNGIQTAFLTSIFGISASIVFNMFYKKQLIEIEKNLDDFYAAYYDCIEHSRESKHEELIYEKLDSIIKSTNKLPAVIAETFVSDQFKNALSNAVQKSIEPSMKDLRNETTDFIKKSVEAQKDILKMLVEGFMMELSNKLNGQFDNLSESINKLCGWQNATSEKLSGVFELLKENYEKLAEMSKIMSDNKASQESINKALSRNLDQMADFVGNVQKYANRMETVAENLDEAIKREAKTLEKIDAFDIDVTKMVELVENLNNNQEKYQAEESRVLKESIDSLSGSTKEMLTEYSNAINDIKQSVTIDTSKMEEYINSINKSMLKISEESPAYADRLRDFLRAVGNIIESLEKLDKVVVETSKRTGEDTDIRY